MKRVLTCLWVGLVTGCGNHEFSRERNKTTLADLNSATSGLQVTVTNSLPDLNTGSPHLNAYFCAAEPDRDPKASENSAPTPSTEERCVTLVGIIKQGTTETYLVSKE